MEEATWTSDETQISFLRLTSTKHAHYLVLLTDTSVALNLRLDLTAVRFLQLSISNHLQILIL